MPVQTFQLQEHHLKLARRMSVGWQDCETGAPEIDPKRPYGNSYVPRDIAEIIGVEWPDEEELSAAAYDREREAIASRMMAIHSEMETVLLIILGNAGEAVRPGLYCNAAKSTYHSPRWVAC